MADNSGVLSTLDNIIAQYSAGGGYATSRGQEQAVLEKKATSGKKQALVSGGMAGTTVAASIPTSVYEEISQPFMTQTEQIRTSSLMDAYMAKAGYLQEEERRAQDAQLAQDQIAADKYASSMAAAAAIHGGGSGSGGGSADAMIDSWRARGTDSSSSGSSGGSGGSSGSGGFGSSSLFGDYSGGGGVYGGAYYPAGSTPGSYGGVSVEGGVSEATDPTLEELAAMGEEWMDLDDTGSVETDAEYPESDANGAFKWITLFGSKFKKYKDGGTVGASSSY